ncbi:MAG: hypothetical protein JXB88_05115 [Spirochaetales bacterium]|nr:hypothetical protein [Spirochaetales bacterium]
MANKRTEENISIITSRLVTVIIVAFIISILFSNLLLLLFLFFKYANNLNIFLIGLAIFFGSFISMILIKAEFIIAIKNNYKNRPPLQLLVIFLSSYFLLFWILPDSFMGQSKISPVILVLLAIPNLAITMILQGLYYFIFMKIINLFSRMGKKKILNEDAIMEKINVKADEIKRYGGTFSLIMITFFVPRFAVNKLKQTMAFSLFYELIRKCIRKTDYLGICGDGDIAVILSNNSQLEKAEVQARRIVDTLGKNSLLMNKINFYKAEFTTALNEYKPEIKEGDYLFHQTIKKIMDDQMLYWERISKSG